MRLIPGVHRGKRMVAGRQNNSGRRVSLGIQDETRERLSVIDEGNGSSRSPPIRAANRYRKRGLRPAIQVMNVDGKRSLRGLLRACAGGCERRHRYRKAQCCNQVKPHTAAKHTYHVHLLQI